MNIQEELFNIMNELGIDVGESGELLDLDSITFITMIIRVEETFGITIPDDLLMISLVNNIYNLETIIDNILSGDN